MLRLDRLCKSYRGPSGELIVLRDVSLELAPGAFVAVQGASGCGKSTLLLAVGGLLAPDSGTVTLAGHDLYALSPERRARLRADAVGFVFQQFHLVPYLSARENVLAASVGNGQGGAAARTDELLERLGLTARADHPPAQLSIGERQRTTLARALLNRPRLLLADEPTGNLDGETAMNAIAQLVEFARAGGAVLLVTHDPMIAATADRVLRLNNGTLTDSSSPLPPGERGRG